MTSEMAEFIGRSPYCKATVRELAGMLPADEAGLDELIAGTVARSDNLQFCFVAMAAFCAGRPVQARHLARGAILLPEKWTVGLFACHMTGEVAGPLLDAVTNTRLTGEILSSALYLAARFHRDERGGKLPGTLIGAARTAARNKQNTVYDRGLLHAVALMSFDEGLQVIVHDSLQVKLGSPRLKGLEEAALGLADQMMGIWRKQPFDVVPDTASNKLAEGETMRRAVARTGRNDPCPCGSGKKYKHCCIEKDRELLHHSTSHAGVTDMELRANPERFLTEVELNECDSAEAARYDPLKIEPKLRTAYLACLCRAKLYDRCVEAMEAMGFDKGYEEAWNNILIRIAQARRKDLVDRMLKLRPDVSDHRIGALELFLGENDPAKLGQTLTEHALHLLKDKPEPVNLVGYATTLLKSPLSALGILVARGVIPVLPQKEASQLLEELLRTRDLLCLSPDDPISDVLDRRFLENPAGEGRETAALREAQQRLNAKMQEVQRYKENVDRLEKELARREQTAGAPLPAAPVESTPTPPPDPGALQELRQKVSDLKSALKERHNERNQLRRELQSAHTDLDELRQKSASTAASPAPEEMDHEEDWLLPQESDGNQPLRLIEFPKNFRETLSSLPKSVARGTLTLLGRLAAGEPAAFVGAVRLKAIPSITRARIGIDFRLLFRLLPDRVQVVDLIPRQDLERRIKTLL
jgi:hypothetical protein